MHICCHFHNIHILSSVAAPEWFELKVKHTVGRIVVDDITLRASSRRRNTVFTVNLRHFLWLIKRGGRPRYLCKESSG